MNTEISRADWERLFDAADRFAALTPWEWMLDSQLFGVVDPESGQKLYCSIMGNLGDFFALGVYAGAEGYRSYRMMYDIDEDTTPTDALYHQSCLVASFEGPEELDPEDRELASSLDRDYGETRAWPGFRSYRPGMVPWGLEPDDARMLTLALDQAHAFAREARDKDLAIPTQEIDEVPKELLFRKMEDGEWKTVKMTPDSPVNLSPPQLQFEEAQLERFLGDLEKAEKYWLVEVFYLEQPGMEPGDDRPYFPKAFMMLDLETQEIVGMDAVKPFEVTTAPVETCIEVFRHHGFIPSNFVVSNRDAYILLKNFSKALGITISIDENMDIVDDLKESLFAHMRGMEED